MKKNKLLLCLVFLCISFALRAQDNLKPFFPKMEPADKFVYVSIGTDDAEAKHIARVFQGIINREKAEVFLASDIKETNWLKYTGKEFTRPPFVLTGSNKGLRSLVKMYKDRIKKLVVCNFSNNDYTWNMAVNMAAVDDVLPVSEELKNSLIEEFDWDVEVVDIRNKWSNISEAYDWALKEIMPQINKKMFFSLGLRDDWQGGGWALYDYAVATRSFSFWLDNHNGDQIAIIQKILRTPGYPKNSCVMGYGKSGDDLNDVINPEGFGFLVGDFFPNASAYSSFETKTFTQPSPKAIELLNNKIYVVLHWSDGDNIQFNHNASYDIFNQEARGEVPVSMTLSPALMEIAPFILNYYYENATENDELIGGPSGLQYIQEKNYKPEDFEDWCKLDGEWLAAAGMTATASSFEWPARPFFLNSFLKTNLLGTIAWTNSSYKDAYFWNGMPVIATGGNVGSEDDLYNYLKSLQPNPFRPIISGSYLVQAPFGGQGYASINNVAKRLESEFPGRYVFLKASDLFLSARNFYQENHKPFKSLTIPGTIQFEDFDKGGQGIGYYVSSSVVKESDYRNEPGLLVGIDNADNVKTVTLNEREWLNFSVNIKETATYKVTYRYTGVDNNSGITMILDDSILSTSLFNSVNGSFNEHVEYVNLSEGEHLLKIQSIATWVRLDFMSFEKANFEKQNIYADKLYKVKSKTDNKVLTLVNSSKIIFSEDTNDDTQLWQIQMIDDGYYWLKSYTDGNCITLRGNNIIQLMRFDNKVDIAKWQINCIGENEFSIVMKRKQIALTNDNGNAECMDFKNDDKQIFILESVDSPSQLHPLVGKGAGVLPFPIPFDNIINFKGVEEGACKLSLYNANGTLVYKAEELSNTNTVSFNTSNIEEKGEYIYLLEDCANSYSGILLK